MAKSTSMCGSKRSSQMRWSWLSHWWKLSPRVVSRSSSLTLIRPECRNHVWTCRSRSRCAGPVRAWTSQCLKSSRVKSVWSSMLWIAAGMSLGTGSEVVNHCGTVMCSFPMCWTITGGWMFKIIPFPAWSGTGSSGWNARASCCNSHLRSMQILPRRQRSRTRKAFVGDWRTAAT